MGDRLKLHKCFLSHPLHSPGTQEGEASLPLFHMEIKQSGVNRCQQHLQGNSYNILGPKNQKDICICCSSSLVQGWQKLSKMSVEDN